MAQQARARPNSISANGKHYDEHTELNRVWNRRHRFFKKHASLPGTHTCLNAKFKVFYAHENIDIDEFYDQVSKHAYDLDPPHANRCWFSENYDRQQHQFFLDFDMYANEDNAVTRNHGSELSGLLRPILELIASASPGASEPPRENTLRVYCAIPPLGEADENGVCKFGLHLYCPRLQVDMETHARLYKLMMVGMNEADTLATSGLVFKSGTLEKEGGVVKWQDLIEVPGNALRMICARKATDHLSAEGKRDGRTDAGRRYRVNQVFDYDSALKLWSENQREKDRVRLLDEPTESLSAMARAARISDRKAFLYTLSLRNVSDLPLIAFTPSAEQERILRSSDISMSFGGNARKASGSKKSVVGAARDSLIEYIFRVYGHRFNGEVETVMTKGTAIVRGHLHCTIAGRMHHSNRVQFTLARDGMLCMQCMNEECKAKAALPQWKGLRDFVLNSRLGELLWPPGDTAKGGFTRKRRRVRVDDVNQSEFCRAAKRHFESLGWDQDGRVVLETE